MERMESRPGHGVPADDLIDDPFVVGLVEWTAKEAGHLDEAAPRRRRKK